MQIRSDKSGVIKIFGGDCRIQKIAVPIPCCVELAANFLFFLIDEEFRFWMFLFESDCAIESGGAAANHCDSHGLILNQSRVKALKENGSTYVEPLAPRII